MKILKFLVIVDDALLREALCGASREALRELEREAIVFEASDRSEAIRIVKQHGHIDLILLDLELPETDSFELLRELEALLFPGRLGADSPFLPLDLSLSWYPTVSLVVVSELQDHDIFENDGPLPKEMVQIIKELTGRDCEPGQNLVPRGVSRALDEGAVGFIPKSASREMILDGFRTIFAGGHCFPVPPTPSDPCEGPVKPPPMPPRTPGTAQAVDAADPAAVAADLQGRTP